MVLCSKLRHKPTSDSEEHTLFSISQSSRWMNSNSLRRYCRRVGSPCITEAVPKAGWVIIGRLKKVSQPHSPITLLSHVSSSNAGTHVSSPACLIKHWRTTWKGNVVRYCRKAIALVSRLCVYVAQNFRKLNSFCVPWLTHNIQRPACG